MQEFHGRGFVSCIEYHLVWPTKYRRKVISEEIGFVLKDIFTEIAPKFQDEILEFNFCEDHVHILLGATPHTNIPMLIKQMKGSSARIIFQRFPEIKRKLWGGNLWNPSYFICTVSDRTEEQITRYIQNQKEKG